MLIAPYQCASQLKRDNAMNITCISLNRVALVQADVNNTEHSIPEM